jgi:hypothetical protein
MRVMSSVESFCFGGHSIFSVAGQGGTAKNHPASE